MNNFSSAGKKYLFAISVIALLAAGCSGSSNTQVSTEPTPAPIQSIPTETPTPTITPTSLPSPSTTPTAQVKNNGKVQVISLSPISAAVGTKVAITGKGFTKIGNQIMFGSSSGRHHPDGSADNVIATVDSANGKTLIFTIPATGPSGILCDDQNHCIGITAITLSPGIFPVSVSNSAGLSNSVNIVVSK